MTAQMHNGHEAPTEETTGTGDGTSPAQVEAGVVKNPAEGLLSTILERVQARANAEVIYGESRTVGGKAIIPVGTVMYGFGAGGGAGTGPSTSKRGVTETSTGSGGGGGGGVRVHPVAILEVSDGQTKVIPVLDWTRIITTPF
ncbi:MAG: spore germination protein GerW family protein [Chloroflexi bacterium]|nr:spore germination protein GerW family protein [Chloroflexota bacterium]